MSKRVKGIEFGDKGWLYLSLNDIIVIRSYYDDIKEYCPETKLPWWNILRWMGVKGYDCPKDREVYADFMGRPYTFVGKTQMMEVVMTSGDRYRFEWDGEFYARWMEFK